MMSSGPLQIALWWLAFAGTHVGGSALPVRTWLIDRFGLSAFKLLYSVVSFATFVPLLVVYFGNVHTGGRLFVPPAAAGHLAEVLVVLAFVLLAQGYTTFNPVTTLAEMSGRSRSSARGIQRITRHPNNTGFALFALAHMLVNPWASDWVFFGGFVLFALVSSAHQDSRLRATGPEPARQFLRQTSLLPFAAILGGRQQLRLRELKPVPVVVAIVLAIVLRIYHQALIGQFTTTP